MKISFCYVDDRIDTLLERYLEEFCESQSKLAISLEFETYEFQKTDDYKTLLYNDIINNSKIILIDSKLFENENGGQKKFTGEQFKIILKHFFPYIHTIVLTQNDIPEESLNLKKFSTVGVRDTRAESKKYYDQTLADILKELIKKVYEEQIIIDEISYFEEVDSLLTASLQKANSGIIDSAIFTKQELDELITLFKDVKKRYE